MRRNPDRLYEELYSIGESGTEKEFIAALKKFGADERMVEALADGLANGRKRDGFSDYATTETPKLAKKGGILRDFDLRLGTFKSIPTKGEVDEKSLQAIFTTLARIEERLGKLEETPPAGKRCKYAP